MATSSSNLPKKKHNSARISELSQIAQLPKHQQILLELLLVTGEMSYQKLCSEATHLPNGHALTQLQIDSTLYELISVGYLSSFIEDSEIIYMVQLKGKREKRDEQRLWKDLGLGAIYEQLQKRDD